MEEKVLKAALAGLLHDVGKLEQRARDDPWNPAPGIDREGQPVHATWTIYFIQNYIPQKYKGAAYAGAYHHNPDKSPAENKELSELIALADKLSAGERSDLDEEDKRPPRQRVSIFDQITSKKGEEKNKGWHYLPLDPLSLSSHAIFPCGELPDNDQTTAYSTLCEELRIASKLSVDDDLTYIENLLYSMQRITWNIPSAYYHSIPDVSMYDHSRMTAALAACLSEMPAKDTQELLTAVEDEFHGTANENEQILLKKPVALLVGGDISGIQDFLYTISSKGAAKTLRGRSFYLQLLTEAVLRFMLTKLGLPYVNVIYSGGGHFYFLAPLSTAKKLPSIRRQITEIMLKHHGVALYMAIGHSQIPATGFKLGEFPKYWKMMHMNLGEAKQHRYIELGEDLYPKIFQPPEKGGNPEDTCSICGDDHRRVDIWDEEREEQARICDLCRSFTDSLGKPLPTSQFIALGFGQPKELRVGEATNVLEEFGMRIQFLENTDTVIDPHGAERIIFWALDDPENGKWPECSGIPTSRMLRYTVNHIPPMTFDELRNMATGGYKRLGVLRMDVDNLGEIFQFGLGKTASLARLSTLSLQMSLYFEGWVKHICEEKKYKKLIYAVYAGGDDVFLIGPWDIMPDLAQQINDEFANYTGDHPALHLSAGLAFIGGKYPVYQAAEDAKDTLGIAKDLPEKNAFSFLGTAWPWSAFTSLSDKQSRMVKLVSGKEADEEGLEGPQAILQVLRQLAVNEADEFDRKKARPVWGPWMWKGAYQLKRMAERVEKGNPALAKAILDIRDELNENDYKDINQWGTAARWTQLEIRKENIREE